MIWFDVENSPHVVFLKPIMEYLEENGIDYLVTAREYSETTKLLKKYGITHTVVGKYGGKNKILKIYNVLKRAFQLTRFLRDKKIKLSISHGSRPHCITSKILGVRSFTLYDYEYTETLLFNKLADFVGIPDMVPLNVIDSIGLPRKKLIHYPGLKEENYIWKYKLNRLDFLPNEKIIVTLRPPSMTANYHDRKSDLFFDGLMRKLIEDKNIFVVCIPRTHKQREYIENRYRLRKHFYIPNEPLNGMDLLYSSDVVISGGGTMNREAVVLGRRVYSIFGGKPGSIDLELERMGKLKMIRNIDELKSIEFKKMEEKEPKISDKTFKFIIKHIMWLYNKP